jgi:hypothetical protein
LDNTQNGEQTTKISVRKKVPKNSQQKRRVFFAISTRAGKRAVFGIPRGGPSNSGVPKKPVSAKKACARNAFFPFGAGKY